MNIILFSSQAEESVPSAQIATMQPLEESFSYSRNAGVYKIATEMRNLGHTVEVIDFLVYWPDDDIKNLLGFKFFGYTHFSFMQWYQLWQVIVINDIVETFIIDY